MSWSRELPPTPATWWENSSRITPRIGIVGLINRISLLLRVWLEILHFDKKHQMVKHEHERGKLSLSVNLPTEYLNSSLSDRYHNNVTRCKAVCLQGTLSWRRSSMFLLQTLLLGLYTRRSGDYYFLQKRKRLEILFWWIELYQIIIQNEMLFNDWLSDRNAVAIRYQKIHIFVSTENMSSNF